MEFCCSIKLSDDLLTWNQDQASALYLLAVGAREWPERTEAPAAVWDPAELLAGRSAMNLQKRVEILALRFPLSLFKSASASLVLLLTELPLYNCRSLVKFARTGFPCTSWIAVSGFQNASGSFSSSLEASSVPFLCARLFSLSSCLYVLDASKCILYTILYPHLSSSTRVSSILLTSVKPNRLVDRSGLWDWSLFWALRLDGNTVKPWQRINAWH